MNNAIDKIIKHYVDLNGNNYDIYADNKQYIIKNKYKLKSISRKDTVENNFNAACVDLLKRINYLKEV